VARADDTLGAIARKAGRDLEEALVMAWDAGLDWLLDVDQRLTRRQESEVRQALHMPSKAQSLSIAHWAEARGESEEEFRKYLRSLGFRLSQDSRKLPKGALRTLQSAGVTRPVVRPNLSAYLESAQPEEAEPPFEWEQVGSARPCSHLSAEDLRAIHRQLTDDFANSADPIDPPGVRDESLLASAAFRSQTALGGTEKYGTPEMVAAALLHSVIHNHPFHNGNKRSALVAALCSLDCHNITITASQEELFRFVLKVAQHKLVPKGYSERADREVLEIARWLRRHSRQLDKGERPLRWGQLRKILVGFDCTLEQPSGNRMNIQRRVVERRSAFGLRRQAVLRVQVAYGDEGREVDKNALNHLRKELRLDHEHGVDSETFYGRDRRPVDDFIVEYRGLLGRLARL
jgi:death-on-curing family protein